MGNWFDIYVYIVDKWWLVHNDMDLYSLDIGSAWISWDWPFGCWIFMYIHIIHSIIFHLMYIYIYWRLSQSISWDIRSSQTYTGRGSWFFTRFRVPWGLMVLSGLDPLMRIKLHQEMLVPWRCGWCGEHSTDPKDIVLCSKAFCC